MSKIDNDVRITAKSVIKGNEYRKKRIRLKNASPFDLLAAVEIERCLGDLWLNVENAKVRKIMQGNIYKSIVQDMPYEHIHNPMCGRRQFYEARNELVRMVAVALDMAPGE